MSLFFLILTLIIYTLGVLVAKTTKPEKQNLLENNIQKFGGSRDDLDKVVKLWLINNSKLSILKNTKDYICLDEKNGFLSFGSFYHISIQENGEGLDIQITAQNKLVGAPTDENNLRQKINLDIKDVG